MDKQVKQKNKWDDYGWDFDDELEFNTENNFKQNNNPDKRKYSGGQKFVFGIIVVLSGTALVMAVSSYAQNIRKPFEQPINNSGAASLEDNNIEDELAALEGKDTDQDGISDYDELYKYDTSPYIKDSDSDGYTDKEEIDSGHDPNCPTGKNCYKTTTQNDSDEIVENEEFDETTTSLLSGNMSPNELRALLSELGIASAELNSLSDEQLIDIYENTLDDSKQEFAEAEDYGASSQTQQNLPDIENLTTEEIRQLLIEGGLDREFVENIDEETLIQVYEETLNNIN